MSEKILVLGAGGFVGRHLVRALVHDGRSVVAVSRRPADYGATPVEAIVATPREPSDLLPLLDHVRTVVHLASASSPGSSAGQPLHEIDDNLRPTLALLQAMQQRPDCGLLYVSSGGTLYGDTPGAAANEYSPLHPKSYHGAGKAAAEQFVGAWCSQYDTSATILRPSNVYGPGQSERIGFGIIPCAMGKMLRRETLTVLGDGSAERDYLYIDDFIALCMRVLASRMPRGACALNAASGIDTSLNTLFDTLELATGMQLLRTHAPARAVDVARIALDPSLARRIHGWSATTSLTEGLQRTWSWFNTIRH